MIYGTYWLYEDYFEIVGQHISDFPIEDTSSTRKIEDYLEINRELIDEDQQKYQEMVYQDIQGVIHGFYRVYKDNLQIVDEHRTYW